MFHGFINGATVTGKTQQAIEALPLEMIVRIMFHSVAMGILLAVVTFMAVRSIYGKQNVNTPAELFQLLIGSSNLLFLCVGMTGITLLINNNIVRAFAIIAALALVRFRVKLDQKNINASILFSVLAGTACGLQEVPIAWVMIGFYIILLGALIILLTAFKISPAAVTSQYSETPQLAPDQPIK